MAAGRPRATVRQLELHGIEKNTTAHKNYANPDVSKNLIMDIPSPPSHYSVKTKDAWNKILPGLIAMRVLTEHDLVTLTSGFDAYEEMIQAQKKIREFDKAHKELLDSNSIKDRKTLSSWMLTSMAEANKVFCRFGLTLRERTRLNLIPEKKKDEDPLSVVLGD